MQRAILAHPLIPWLIKTDLTAADGWDRTKMSPHDHSVSLGESQYRVIYSTNPCSTLDDGVEHRLHVCWRAADNAQYLGRCGLMFQGFPQFRIAFLDLLEQAHIFNRDHGLVGKRLEKFDLSIRKRANFGS